MPGPWKPYNANLIGVTTQHLYGFLQELFGNQGQALRDQLMHANDENQLRIMLGNWGILIPANVNGLPLRIMMVDIQNARTWQDRNQNPIKPNTDYFYLLTLPPVPSNPNYAGQPGYKDMQAWESAWYHAIVDGYGM